jgi:DNA-binding MarR family transcriptional regulator
MTMLLRISPEHSKEAPMRKSEDQRSPKRKPLLKTSTAEKKKGSSKRSRTTAADRYRAARGPGRVEAHAIVRDNLKKVLAGAEGVQVHPGIRLMTPLARLLTVIKFMRALGLRDMPLQALGILIVLYNAPADGIQGGLTFAEIAEQVGVQQSSVSKHTAQLGTFYTSGVLCGFGLLEVFPDLIERGRLRARLTPSGRGLLTVIEATLSQ